MNDNGSLPGRTDRTVIVGSNGSGKTQFAAWLLSTRDYKRRPWTIFNTKNDALLDRIGAKELSTKAKPPTRPGLYQIKYLQGRDGDLMNEYMERVFRQEDSGLYIDEGYAVPQNSYQLQALMTQGRSKNIEVLFLAQRPVNIRREVLSEGTYYAIFRLTDKRDRDTVRSLVPINAKIRLPPFHSWWYSVRQDQLSVMKPVPQSREIVGLYRPQHNTQMVVI